MDSAKLEFISQFGTGYIFNTYFGLPKDFYAHFDVVLDGIDPNEHIRVHKRSDGKVLSFHKDKKTRYLQSWEIAHLVASLFDKTKKYLPHIMLSIMGFLASDNLTFIKKETDNKQLAEYRLTLLLGLRVVLPDQESDDGDLSCKAVDIEREQMIKRIDHLLLLNGIL